MKVRTKLNETDKNRVETDLSFDWENVTTEELQTLAGKSLAITWQGQCRKDGAIPAGEVTVRVRDLLDRERAPRGPVDVAKLLEKLSPEERAAILAKFTA